MHKKVNKISYSFSFHFPQPFLPFQITKKMLPFHFKLLKNWEFFPFLTERRIEGGGRGCLLTSLCLLYKLQREVKRQLPERSGKFSLARGVEKKKGRKSVELDAAFRRRKNCFPRHRFLLARNAQAVAVCSCGEHRCLHPSHTTRMMLCASPTGEKVAKSEVYHGRGKKGPWWLA